MHGRRQVKMTSRRSLNLWCGAFLPMSHQQFIFLSRVKKVFTTLSAFQWNILERDFDPRYSGSWCIVKYNPCTNSLNRSPYIFLKNQLGQFSKRSKLFSVGDHFIESHYLSSHYYVLLCQEKTDVDHSRDFKGQITLHFANMVRRTYSILQASKLTHKQCLIIMVLTV